MKRAEVAHQRVNAREANFGDLSRTYRFPGYATLDQLRVNFPKTFARHSPYVARVLTDGSYLRAAIRPLAMVLPLLSVVFASIAAMHLGADPLPRSATLFASIAVIGILDALAGLAATVVFMVLAMIGTPPFAPRDCHRDRCYGELGRHPDHGRQTALVHSSPSRGRR